MTLVPHNRVIQGDCVAVMRGLPAESVDLVFTDPPYLVAYRDRHGRTVANDSDDSWLRPAFAEMYRILKSDSYCLTFYGWPSIAAFADAWQAAGFRIVGHIVFRKSYASSAGALQRYHESAYLLAKGCPPRPSTIMPDVAEWRYTSNRLHPTQKSSVMLQPYVDALCKPDGLVLDPFCGSGATLVAAHECGRRYLGIELDEQHALSATLRLEASRMAALARHRPRASSYVRP
jgi:site-specific DNA-methyltransferase (adenine-specific)